MFILQIYIMNFATHEQFVEKSLRALQNNLNNATVVEVSINFLVKM